MTAGPVAVQQTASGERLLVANENSNGGTVSLAAFNPATGNGDSTFGTSNGIATMTLPAGDSVFEIDALFVNPADGAIAVEGEFQIGSGWDYQIGLVQFDATGNNPTLVLATATMIDPNNGSGAAMDGNGNIVVTFAETTGPSGNDSLAAVRYTESGIDPNFGASGLFTLDVPSAQSGGSAAAFEPGLDGDVILGGSAWNLSDNCPGLVVCLTPGGVLDPSFNFNNGNGYAMVGSIETATALAAQPDGKILVGLEQYGGSYPTMSLTRLNSDGTTDTSFGGAPSGPGTVSPIFTEGGNSLPATYLGSLDLQADGDAVVVGAACSADYETSYLVMARYELGYTAVTEAAIGGETAVTPGSYTLYLSPSGDGSGIGGWSINWGDGATQQIVGDPASVEHDYAASENPYTIEALAYVEGPGAGNLDQEHFGTDGSGTVVAGPGDIGSWSAISPTTGEIFVSAGQTIYGYSSGGNLETTIGLPSGMTAFGPLAIQGTGGSERLIVADADFGMDSGTVSVASFNPATGSLDGTFGTSNGIATMTLSAGDSLFEIDGVFVEPLTESIAVEGEFYIGTGLNYQIGLVQFESNGHSHGNLCTTGVPIDWDNGSGAAMDPQGNIVVAFSTYADNLAVVRYLANGTLDTTNFGTGGLFTLTALSAQSGGDAVAIQPDGSIVIGSSAWNLTDNCPALVVHLTSGGDLDMGFNNNSGYVLGPDFSTGTALVAQPDGKVIVGLQGYSSFSLMRLNSDGTVDTSFGADGTVSASFYDSSGNPLPASCLGSMDLQADGDLAVVGTAYSADSQSYLVLACYELGYTTSSPMLFDVEV